MNENKTDRKPGQPLVSLAATLALIGVAGVASAAPTPDRTGKEVVEAVCSGCHATGKEGAPKIGDQAEWARRASQGLRNITQHAITGVRKMPPHGGESSLTDLEISRAVAYMVSGGLAADPNKAYSSPKQKDGEQLVLERCQECHAAGKDGAPRIGELEDWKPRLQAGVDNLVRSAIRGHKGMPSRAGIASLSDTDIRGAVIYMVSQGAVAKAQ